ncbi:alanine racemase [Desulfovibrio ferrophilus]|uniref:Alanine racemase n=1 Tax=Desulfovibrio ferrophilus TaxID=241368 RepID=A0A2Z6AWK5_9BACT|nr:alanine racemase [Desulfovibrio ferrophilus]BBD07637.1 alanine racemase [Desulfovibrio ferrophilus]
MDITHLQRMSVPDFGPFPLDVETPCVLVDGARLAANIERVAAIGRCHRVAVRPHIKTHKSVDIARMQMQAGACGVTASKVDEALVFVRAGIPSVTCAYPVLDGAKLDRLLAVGRDYDCDLRCLADSDAGVTALHQAGERAGLVIPVSMKIDVGLHRCGVAVDDPALLRLASRVHHSPHLEFVGILSHAGQAYAAKDSAGVLAVARAEATLMRRAKALLEEHGVPVSEVSVGSTPTVLASDDYEGITEIRPGNYVFMDRTPVRLGLAQQSEVALTVLATVVSKNEQWLIIDAGSKTLSSDGGAHGAGATDFGLAYPLGAGGELGAPLVIGRLSEEHGWIINEGANLAIGDKVRIVPNHSCVVVNLRDRLALMGAGGELRSMNIDARGLIR